MTILTGSPREYQNKSDLRTPSSAALLARCVITVQSVVAKRRNGKTVSATERVEAIHAADEGIDLLSRTSSTHEQREALRDAYTL